MTVNADREITPSIVGNEAMGRSYFLLEVSLSFTFFMSVETSQKLAEEIILPTQDFHFSQGQKCQDIFHDFNINSSKIFFSLATRLKITVPLLKFNFQHKNLPF